MSKIKITDTIKDMMIGLSEGNPGALTVCVNLMRAEPSIDPDNMLAGIGSLLELDQQEIYGPRIWMLYKDVCKEDITKTIAVLRSCQLGLVSKNDLVHAIDNHGNGLNVNDICVKVKEKLPNFGQQESADN